MTDKNTAQTESELDVVVADGVKVKVIDDLPDVNPDDLVVGYEDEDATDEEKFRDEQAKSMAADLEEEDKPVLTNQEQEAAAIEETKAMLSSDEGAQMAALGAINWYEKILQKQGNKRFKIADDKKEDGVESLVPMIKKYAPNALGLFGQYKDEVMAAMFVGSMAYGSVKQIKALNAEDLAEDMISNPEKYKKPQEAPKEAA
jgi:hypothetical protein